MTIDFQKLGLGKVATSLGKSIGGLGGGTSTLFTGDITKGEIIQIGIASGDDSGTATVAARRTGAILLSVESEDFTEYTWSITDTTLTVEQNDSDESTYTFWVF